MAGYLSVSFSYFCLSGVTQAGIVHSDTFMGLGQMFLALVLIATVFLRTISARGLFPPLVNIAANKPLLSYPVDSTCGVPVRTAHCRSYPDKMSFRRCDQVSFIH